MNPRHRPGSEAAWATAIIVIAVSLLSTFTLSSSSSSSSPGTTTGALSTTPNGTITELPPALKGGKVVDSQTHTAVVNGQKQQVITYTVKKAGKTYHYTVPASSVSSSSGTTGSGTTLAGGTTTGGGTTTPGGTTPGGGTATGDGTATGGTGTGTGTNPNADCSQNQNSGATDWGITSNAINMAATVVQGGVAKDFLYPAVYGIQAIQNKINRSGGICGRLLHIQFQNDDWDFQTGEHVIAQFIACKCYFGLAVNPSSEGLRGAIDGGLLDQNNFPAVGTDGMLIDQYKDPWVWPVATSTHSVMHIIADWAASKGAKNVGIIWDDAYHFGPEGADAFINEAQRQGMNVVEKEDINTQQNPDWGNAVKNFQTGCSSSASHEFDKCDFVAMVLEPTPALSFVQAGGLGDGKQHPRYGIGVPQPLFYTPFAHDCGAPCNGMVAFTSFNPPVQPYASSAVDTYVQDMHSEPSTDVNNPEVEGAYQGMMLLWQALKTLGAAPTRAALQQSLDGMTLDTGLAKAATFQSGNHFAVVSAQGLSAVYNGNSFVGWRYNTGWLTDGEVSQDLG